ncbi:hypothetical protein [Chromobacterium phragmitis]|uniref:hypothetical protein n=2 Tax=Chromobacterium phragmitis TaxID=2202141 RepID=UPI0011AE7FF9|nr:hypothetical protein [Chromobacterium phragmitis]
MDFRGARFDSGIFVYKSSCRSACVSAEWPLGGGIVGARVYMKEKILRMARRAEAYSIFSIRFSPGKDEAGSARRMGGQRGEEGGNLAFLVREPLANPVQAFCPRLSF